MAMQFIEVYFFLSEKFYDIWAHLTKIFQNLKNFYGITFYYAFVNCGKWYYLLLVGRTEFSSLIDLGTKKFITASAKKFWPEGQGGCKVAANILRSYDYSSSRGVLYFFTCYKLNWKKHANTLFAVLRSSTYYLAQF